MKKQLIIGLTGGIGSGKSTVCKLFRAIGITVIDADKIVRKIAIPSSPLLRKIITKFGKSILKKDKTLHRKMLRDIIFNDSSAKKWLENLLHPVVYKTMIAQAKKAKSPYVILDIPLLTETILNRPSNIRDPLTYLDRILVVDTTKKLQIERIKKRDLLSENEIKKIIKQQATRKERLEIADDVLKNLASIDNLKIQIKMIHKKYILLSCRCDNGR